MISIILNAVFLGVVALAAAWLGNNAGEVQILWLGYYVKTSVGFLIGFIALFGLVLRALLVKPLSWIGESFSSAIRTNEKAERIAKAKVAKEIDRYALLGQATTALLAGQTGLAEKLARQVDKRFSADEIERTVFEAQLKEAQGNTEEALRLYGILSANEGARVFGIKGKIRLFRMKNDILEALNLCRALLEEKNCPAWAVLEAFEMQMKEKLFDDALTTLEKGLKQDVYDKTAFRRLKADVLLKKAELEPDEEVRRKLTFEAYDADEASLRATLAVSAYYAQSGAVKKAKGVLEKAYKATPCLWVYKAYADLLPKDNKLEAVREIEELARHSAGAALNDLMLAEVSLKANLWGQAKSYAEKYLDSMPESEAAWKILAQAAEQSKDEESLKTALEKISRIESKPSSCCPECPTNCQRHIATLYKSACPA